MIKCRYNSIEYSGVEYSGIKYSGVEYSGVEYSTSSVRRYGEVHGKVARWIERITEFNIEYHHRRNNTKVIRIADRLSRLPNRFRDTPREFKDRLEFNITGMDIPTVSSLIGGSDDLPTSTFWGKQNPR